MSLPFQATQLINLTDLGIPSKCFSFASIASQKAGLLTITNTDSEEVYLVDLHTKTKKTFRNIAANLATVDFDGEHIACCSTLALK